MIDFQKKYLEQKRKCDNLLKMQTSIFNDADEYSKALLNIRKYIKKIQQEDYNQEQQLTPQSALQYSEDIITYIKRIGRPCECNRWKNLYQKQSQQNLKLNLQAEQLLKKIKQKQQQQQKDRIQINQLLNDYLQLFKKQYDGVKQQKDQQKKKDKKKQVENRSKSKNKISSQTQRKHTKNTSNLEIQKDQNYSKLILQKLQRDLTNMHKQQQQLRDKNIELKQILRIYQTKQRNHLLTSECKWLQ